MRRLCFWSSETRQVQFQGEEGHGLENPQFIQSFALAFPSDSDLQQESMLVALERPVIVLTSAADFLLGSLAS